MKNKNNQKPAPKKGLSKKESTRLASLETTIKNGLSKFIEVGEALAEIQNDELYRATHSSFGAYCTDKLGISRAHGNRLVKASEIREIVNPKLVDKGLTEITTERTLREFGRLKEEEIDPVIDVLVKEAKESGNDGGRFSFKKLKEEVNNRRKKSSTKPVAKKPVEKSKPEYVRELEELAKPVYDGTFQDAVIELMVAAKNRNMGAIFDWMDTHARGFVESGDLKGKEFDRFLLGRSADVSERKEPAAKEPKKQSPAAMKKDKAAA